MAYVLTLTTSILSYLVANLTQWTTHCTVFMRLDNLCQALIFAVDSQRIFTAEARVGAAKNAVKNWSLKTDAEEHCNLIYTHWKTD